MIYIVEDDPGIRKLLSVALSGNGYEVKDFESGEGVVESIERDKPELVLLDLMLPKKDGLKILSEVRTNAHIGSTPIILVTAKDTEYDKVVGLESGADDYISKPFSMMELLSRVKAVLRRSSRREDILTAGEIVLSPTKHSVTVKGEEVQFTLKEFELLRHLLENPGVVLSRDTLLSTVWGYDFPGETRTVDVHIRHLREKLGEEGALIETVKGVGYKIKETK